MKSMIYAILLSVCLLGCATPEARARLSQLEAELDRARVELQAADDSTDTAKVFELETELARLQGAVTEAGNQVARERESSFESSVRNVGGAAGALAPLLGYFLPGAAGVLQVVAGLLARRKD